MVVGGVGLSKYGNYDLVIVKVTSYLFSLSRSGHVRRVEDSVEIWSSVTGSWRQGPRLPQPVFGAAMLELSGQPVLLGHSKFIACCAFIIYLKHFRRKSFKKKWFGTII